MWLDGADTSTMTFNGSKVSQWTDKSSTGISFGQANASYQPTYSLDSSNNRSSLKFTNGTGTILNPTNTALYPINSQRFSVFVAMRFSDPAVSALQTVSRKQNGTPAGDEWIRYQTNISFYIGESEYQTTLTNTAASGVWSGIVGTTMDLWINGSVIGSASRSTNAVHSNNFSVGGDSAGAIYGMSGWIYEYIIYNTAFSTTQRQTMEGYLAWKWNLQASLPANHPYSSSAPSVPNSLGISRPALSLALAPTGVKSMGKSSYYTSFLPTQITGCALWLDAADSTTFTYSSGINISQWKDKTVNGFNATQFGTGTTTYSANGLGGYPAVNFANTNANMVCSIPAGTFPSGVTGFVVANTNSGTIARCVNNIPAPFDGAGTSLVVGNGSGFQVFSSSYNLGSSSSPIVYAFTVTTPMVFTQIVNGTTYTNYSIYSTAAAYGDTATTITIGVRQDKGWAATGYFSEILVYTSVLTNTQIQQIEGYLASKWGLQGTLPSNHPYAATVPAGIISLRPAISQALVPAGVKIAVPIRSWSTTVKFSYTGADQSYVVPAGVTSIKAILWGAGGGGGYVGTGTVYGGAGAYLEGILKVTPSSTLTIIVGRSGLYADGGGGNQFSVYGGGGAPGYNAGGGGGRTAIVYGAIELVTVGAGGGGSYWAPNAMGGAGDSVTGTGDNAGVLGSYGGLGGTQTAGGAHPSNGGSNGSLHAGGNATAGFDGGGGGSGYYGGGAGGFYGDLSGGGGGSSFSSNLSAIVAFNSPNRYTAPYTTSPFYVTGIANGGSNGQPGGHGYLVIQY